MNVKSVDIRRKNQYCLNIPLLQNTTASITTAGVLEIKKNSKTSKFAPYCFKSKHKKNE